MRLRILIMIFIVSAILALAPNLHAAGQIQNGLYLAYGAGGELSVLQYRHDLQPEGVTFIYHPNAEVKQQYAYKNSRIHGNVRTFNSAGELLDTCMYVEGRYVGCY